MSYDVTYNLCQYTHVSNPLQTVTMHPKEDYEEPSGLYRAIERFERHRLNERFNLSLLDYLSLPRDVVDMLTKISIKISERYDKLENDAKQENERNGLSGSKK